MVATAKLHYETVQLPSLGSFIKLQVERYIFSFTTISNAREKPSLAKDLNLYSFKIQPTAHAKGFIVLLAAKKMI
jgi:hypothetical protein